MGDIIFEEILAERKQQDQEWGGQNYSLYTRREVRSETIQFPDREILANTRLNCKKRLAVDPCWFDILQEAICEAFGEEKSKKQRKGMVRVAAVAVAIVEYLDRENRRKETSRR
jgi:hypothetical protein